MSNGKSSYVNVKHKRAVRDEIIPRHKYEVAICLPGPDLDVYAEEMRLKGFKTLIGYEKDIDVFIRQQQLAKNITGIEIELNYGDIKDAPLIKGAFFDGDFCCPVNKARECVKKYKKDCTFTFSMGRRAMGKALTINEFFSTRSENILKIQKITPTLEFIRTTGGLWKVISYRDGAPMITFTKVKSR